MLLLAGKYVHIYARIYASGIQAYKSGFEWCIELMICYLNKFVLVYFSQPGHMSVFIKHGYSYIMKRTDVLMHPHERVALDVLWREKFEAC
jgi:hypothetical protein